MDATRINWQAFWNQHIPIDCRVHQFNNLPHTLNVKLNKLTNIKQHNQANSENADVLATAFINANSKKIQFIPQEALPSGSAYEEHIYATGEIPTRNNLHDFFNACIWFTFTQTKIYLNQLQAQVILENGVQAQRGKIRDALTLFDENGAVLVTVNKDIDTAINSFSWKQAFIENRAYWNNSYHQNEHASAEVYIFGHALLEQLVEPRKPLCAHSITLNVPPAWFNQPLSKKRVQLDALMKAHFLTLHHAKNFNTRSFQPLPVLGIPHFWQANENPQFYEDPYVFRQGRRK